MKKLNLKLKSLKKTWDSFPTIWEGMLENGRYIYICYNWGNLDYGVGETERMAMIIYNFKNKNTVGRSFDGSMETDRMLKLLGLKYE